MEKQAETNNTMLRVFGCAKRTKATVRSWLWSLAVVIFFIAQVVAVVFYWYYYVVLALPFQCIPHIMNTL